jgi:hypothetical protein
MKTSRWFLGVVASSVLVFAPRPGRADGANRDPNARGAGTTTEQGTSGDSSPPQTMLDTTSGKGGKRLAANEERSPRQQGRASGRSEETGTGSPKSLGEEAESAGGR